METWAVHGDGSVRSLVGYLLYHSKQFFSSWAKYRIDLDKFGEKNTSIHLIKLQFVLSLSYRSD